MYFIDTETIQFQGDTILIQYSKMETPHDVTLHEIFYETVDSTLELIESFCAEGIIGFNLSFDWFHLTQTYNILSVYKQFHGGESFPTVDNYYKIIDSAGNIPSSGKLIAGLTSIYDLALKPFLAFDLMLHGRETLLQVSMSKKPVYLRQVPKTMAKQLIVYLNNMPLAELATGEWQIKELNLDLEEIKKSTDEQHPHLCNVRYIFRTRGDLKTLANKWLGYPEMPKYNDSIVNVVEYSYKPIKGNYRSVAQLHIAKWHSDNTERKYAVDDVKMTADLYEFFLHHQLNGGSISSFVNLSKPARDKLRVIFTVQDLYDYGTGTTNHTLACQVGTCYWSGYSIDRPLVAERFKEQEELKDFNKRVMNYNSPKQCLEYIHDVCDDLEVAFIDKTNKETLEELIKNPEEYSEGVSERAKFIYDSRRVDKKCQLLAYLHDAGRLHTPFRVLGTKSNRMSGGGGAGKSINPQGLGHDKYIRECITFADKNDSLEGGDFSSFEVSIMEAVYGDPQLRADLLSGKSFHGLWGAMLFDMSYEDMLSKKNEDLYFKAKISVFAEAYGADVIKLAEVTGLSSEEVELAKTKFQEKYLKIGDAKKQNNIEHTCIYSLKGKLLWAEPQRHSTSLLGFSRSFEQEYLTIQFLYQLALSLDDEFDLGYEIERRDKIVTGTGAVKSALFSGAFSIMNGIIRASGNHKIQSVGGEMTKRLQEKFWELQPIGIHKYKLKPFNVHDEIDIPMNAEICESVQTVKNNFIKEYKSLIPLLAMDWKAGNNWFEIH